MRQRGSSMGRYRTPTVLAAASLLLTALCAGQAPAAAPPGRVDIDPVVAEQLDEAITAAMRKADIPGVGVGLWIDGEDPYVRAFGTSDKATGVPIKTDMHTRIGSVTKTFAITGVLQLVDDGKVRLDAPISTYLDGVPGGERITVRQLADMRSGLYNYTEDPRWQATFKADPPRSWTPQQLLDIAFKHPANFPPGARWEYSNTNTILLGLLVEKVAGQPLHTYLEQNVFEPAGLDATSLPTGAEIASPFVHGYTNFTPDGATVDASTWNPSWGWAAGAMISDLSDLRSWAKTLATGTLLTPATQAQRLDVVDALPGTGYGLGIFNVQGWIGHNGSLPGYGSLVLYLPEAKATLVVLLNTDIGYQGQEPSTLVGEAITKIVTPDRVYTLPAQQDS
ncbi:serine hydrolase domain-containing protein [Streptomyces sp. NPDC058394]|uniref:serine hydrolase domain-containing protein n=1 Tax=Streptomyces sp. NPDC058394 TaxID=3346477 RepID=UPI003656EA76